MNILCLRGQNLRTDKILPVFGWPAHRLIVPQNSLGL